MANGWERLGAALGGMGQARDKAYRQRLGDNIALGRQDQGLQQDIIKTGGLNGLGDALVQLGYEQPVADGMATIGRAGLNPGHFTKAGGDLQTQEFRQAVVDSPDWDTAQKYLAAIQGRTVDQTKISGGTAYNPLFAPDQTPMRTTEIGTSIIGANQARAGASKAQAAASYARAAATRNADARGAQAHGVRMRGGTYGGGGRSGGSASGGAGKAPTESALNRAFTRMVGEGRDAEEVWDQEGFLDWKRSGLSLDDYVMQRDGPALGIGRKVNFITPSLPGSMRTEGPQALSRDEYRARTGREQSPRAGEVLDGYRFKGGNPNSQSSWERVK